MEPDTFFTIWIDPDELAPSKPRSAPTERATAIRRLSDLQYETERLEHRLRHADEKDRDRLREALADSKNQAHDAYLAVVHILTDETEPEKASR